MHCPLLGSKETGRTRVADVIYFFLPENLIVAGHTGRQNWFLATAVCKQGGERPQPRSGRHCVNPEAIVTGLSHSQSGR